MKFYLIFIFCLSSSVLAQTLPSNAPERQQLIAMGAEILQESKDDTYTVFKFGKDPFFIGKSPERIVIGLNYIRVKKLNQAEEFELHKIVNKLNLDNPIQFVLFEKSLQANVYYFGSYDPKVFARMVLGVSKVDLIIDANPKIYSLINN
jgi:hypothetical protein